MSLSGQGLVQGAVSGGLSGSQFGPWGAAVGGAVGGLTGAFSGAGTPTYDPQTMALQGLSWNLFKQGAGLMYPAQHQLVQYATDYRAPDEAAQEALGHATTQMTQAASSRDRLFQLMGIHPTANQQASLDKQQALGTAQAQAGAANAARRGTVALQQGLVG